MNAVEIEEAVSELVLQSIDPAEFPFQFLAAFSAKDTTLKRLRKGDSNQSDMGGVLWRGNIHLAVAPSGEVGETLALLRASPKTVSAKAKFILATDGVTVEAEDLVNGDPVACPWAELPRHFATFLPLAGISTVKEIKNNPIDVKATGRLNKLYVELLKDNPDWATEDRRHELNQFMARLIFCFFAEDTGIFRDHQFTATITQMSHAGHGTGDDQWGNTHEVLTELFRAMDTPVTHEGNLDPRHRIAAATRPYADVFPYVNGGLFTGATDSPRFSRTARAYLLRAGELDWKEINPDIFGSMIQAVADDGERGELGMHYTSVPNILKVLNPLFLDDLREQLKAAGDSRQKLRNLRKRLAHIRVFDPACGSGNFLVIAYKQMREIEAAIVAKLGGEESLKLVDRRSIIPLSNFYGIEIKGFAAEIARLALLIAEFQADCLYLSQQEARAMVLPLHKTGQIIVGNALRLDWLEVCPPAHAETGEEQDLGGPTGRLALEANGLEYSAGAETYICGNPPYKGNAKKSDEQKEDMHRLFAGRAENWGLFDYVCGWFYQAASYVKGRAGSFAFVATNSVVQGQHVSNFWKPLFESGLRFNFAVRSFRWSNLAANDAGVTVVVIGGSFIQKFPVIYDDDIKIMTKNINAYLLPQDDHWIEPTSNRLSDLPPMLKGNYYGLSDHLLMDRTTKDSFEKAGLAAGRLRKFFGSTEMINARPRYCLWFPTDPTEDEMNVLDLRQRIARGVVDRSGSKDAISNGMLKRPHQFREMRHAERYLLAVSVVSSENRDYLPVDLLEGDCIVSNKCFALYDAPIWNLAIITSRLHWMWIGTVCVRMRTDFSYSNKLGWNTFPVPRLTAQDKADLTRTAENILLAREAHFPGTIANLYEPNAMPDDLRRAHEENDEVLERIYIGRRFRNDTERLEKLFDLYTKMTANQPARAKVAKKGKAA